MTISAEREHRDAARRGLRTRTRSVGEHSASNAAGYEEWSGGWRDNGPEVEVAQSPSMASIAPTMLRGPSISAGLLPQIAPNLPVAYGSTTSHGMQANNSKDSAGQVKFVNSTVEILQNQIRKEEAPKKKRTRTSPDQLRILQKAFSTDPMPNSSARMALAKRLGMNARAVQVWFQNRRAKEKLENRRTDNGKGSSSNADTPTDRNSNNGSHSYAKSPSMSLGNGHNGSERNHQSFNGPNRNSIGSRTRPHSCDSGIPQDMNGGTPNAYDLNMYFGDPSLAQYATGFDMGMYQYVGMDPGPAPLFDDVRGVDSLETLDSTKMPSVYQRFQSMPAAMVYPFSDINGIDMYDHDDLQRHSFEAFGMGSGDCRSNSVDMMGVMHEQQHSYVNGHVHGMGGDGMDDGYRIYSTPSAKDTFLSAPPLGHSIPMKQRSQSVPEIPLSLQSGPLAEDIVHLFRGSELGTIREEEHILECPPPPHPSRKASVAGISSGSLINNGNASVNPTSFPPPPPIMDDFQSYLDSMVTNPRFDLMS